MLQKRTIAIGHLLLDPNNPRLRDNASGNGIFVPDSDLASSQTELRKRLSGPPGVDPHGLEELRKSMAVLGFTGIDRVVVRPIDGSSDFLVLEGNRRIAAAKQLLEDSDRDIAQGKGGLDPQKVETLLQIEAQVVDTKGRTTDEVNAFVSTVLGIRHYGSLLEWEPLPRAHNIYQEYLRLSGDESFALSMSVAGKVSDRLAIKRAKVLDALRSYTAYTQLLAAGFGVERSHYSLIEAVVTKKKLNDGYLKIDSQTLQLEESSLERMNKVCQFADRDARKDKVLPKPQSAAQLARLYTMGINADDFAIAEFAKMKLQEAEEGELALEEACDQAIAYGRRRKWVSELNELLTKQRAGLSVEEFRPMGNALMLREEVEQKLRRLRAVVAS